MRSRVGNSRTQHWQAVVRSTGPLPAVSDGTTHQFLPSRIGASNAPGPERRTLPRPAGQRQPERQAERSRNMNVQLSAAQQSLQAMASGFVHRLPYMGLAVLAYVLFHLAARGLRGLITSLAEKRQAHYAAGLVLGRLIQATVIALGVLVALVIVIPSFQIGQVVQLLGISSVAIGFAFRDVLQNFLAGILILFNQPFRIGDQIMVGAFEGTVESIETRATFIRTYDGRRVVIPNSTLFNDSVTVNTAYAARRLQYDLRLDDAADVDELKHRIRQALLATGSVLHDPPPDVLATDVAGTGVTFRIRWWVEPPRRSDVTASQDAALAAIRRCLDEHKRENGTEPAAGVSTAAGS